MMDAVVADAVRGYSLKVHVRSGPTFRLGTLAQVSAAMVGSPAAAGARARARPWDPGVPAGAVPSRLQPGPAAGAAAGARAAGSYRLHCAAAAPEAPPLPAPPPPPAAQASTVILLHPDSTADCAAAEALKAMTALALTSAGGWVSQRVVVQVAARVPPEMHHLEGLCASAGAPPRGCAAAGLRGCGTRPLGLAATGPAPARCLAQP